MRVEVAVFEAEDPEATPMPLWLWDVADRPEVVYSVNGRVIKIAGEKVGEALADQAVQEAEAICGGL